MKTVWKRWGLFLLLVVCRIEAQEILDRTIHYRPGDWISYPVTRFVTSIALGHQYTYFGTTGGISRYDFYSHRWEHPFTVSDGLEDDRIRVVAYDFETGTLWCATEVGLSYWITSAEEWRNLSYQRLGVDPVTSIGSGKKYLWLESSGKIYRGDRTATIFWKATQEEEAEDDVQWNGSRAENGGESLPDLFAQGGYVYSLDGFIQDVELRQFHITKTFQDAFLNLWLGTWGLGGGVADMRTSYLELLPYGPYSSEVDFMAWDEEGMWMGGRRSPGDPHGITWWDMERNEWIYFEATFLSGLRSDEVSSIAPDMRFVWFGTHEGLARYDKDKDAWRVYSVHDNLWSNRVTSVVRGEGVLWVGTESGINRILLPAVAVEQIRDKRLTHAWIYQLEVDGRNVWAGTDRGIFWYADETAEWEYIPGYGGILGQNVTAISVWEDEVWFGKDDGVEVYDKKSNSWRGFPEAHYPTGGIINTILADSGAVWVGTEEGILKYLKRENRWRRFTTYDGLLDNSVRWILLDGDYVWLGTGRGLTRFYWNAPYRTD